MAGLEHVAYPIPKLNKRISLSLREQKVAKMSQFSYFISGFSTVKL